MGFEWHSMEIEEVLRMLKTDPNGLSSEDAVRRLQEYGYNELREEKRVTGLHIFLSQFKSILVIILIVAAVVSGYIDIIIENEPPLDTYVISAIVVMNAILGFIQEYRAEKAVEALKKMIAPMVRLVREGKERIVPSRELVPGDFILLESGDRVPADSRLIETVSMKVDEAPLTGESIPVVKGTEVLREDVPVSDRTNMVYMGTSVAYGRGKAVVTATGMNSEFGKIAKMVQAVEVEEPPLKQKVEHMGRQLGAISVVLCVLVFFVGFFIYGDIISMFMIGVSLAVSAIPEGLPAVITITLALGVGRMARQRAVVRKLASVETLGCTSVICSDKTGTLTRNEMTVCKLYVNDQMISVTGAGYEPKGEFSQNGEKFSPQDDNNSKLLLRIGSLCNNARLEKNEKNEWQILGDPTEGALIVVAAKSGIWQGETGNQYPRVAEIPFDSLRKRMSTIHVTPKGRKIAYVKGAPEIVLERCESIYENGKVRKLNKKDKVRIPEVTQQMAGEALRLLAMAYKELPNGSQDFSPEQVEKKLTFVGLAGMIDPPRKEVPDAIRLCKQAGIKSVMITGDHKLTAVAIAKEIGMLKSESDQKALTGDELENLSNEDLDKMAEETVVYARVSPEHKVRIAEALKRRGHIVAMTGDGVNDAPAIKTADIGVAMGIKGTDVTKEASDMILEDDNFATIVTAVEGGRHIFDNIRKYLRLMVTANFDEFFEVSIAAFAGLPIPLLPVQILWVNLITDGLPAVALSIDPKEPDLMQRHPRDPKKGLLYGMWFFIIFAALLDFLSDFIPFLWVLSESGNVARARTAAFTSIVLFEFFLAYNCRSETHSILGLGWKGITANKMLFVSVIVSLLLQIAIIYVPFLQVLFQTTALSPLEFAVCAIGACSALLVFPGKLNRR